MIDFLLRANVEIHTMRQKEFHHNETYSKCWIMLDDFHLPNDKESIAVFTDQYTDVIFEVENNDVSAIQKMKKDRIRDHIEKLKPSPENKMARVSSVMAWIKSKVEFEKTVRFLCELSVDNIRSIKIEAGESGYLIWIPFIKTPAILVWFLNQSSPKSGSTLYYPIYRSSYDIWVEWGYSYGFADPSFYQLLLKDSRTNLLINRDGKKIEFSKKINEFIPLIKFSKLSFNYSSQTNTAESRSFGPHEVEFTLKIIKETHRTAAEKQLEKLKQEEENIRREIEWIRSLNALYKDLEIQYVYFYPLGSDVNYGYQKDPVFPEIFFRRHSLAQLNRLCFFYGNLGSLGEGVMVANKYIAMHDSGGRFELSNLVKPRRGLIFQSNPIWLEKTGLRIFSPAGYDVFPYLIDIDPTDIHKIIDAFINSAVWGIQTNAEGVRQRTVSENELKKKAEDITRHPERHIYFLYPKMAATHPEYETEDLECIILEEGQFIDFKVKFQNLGFFFALAESQKKLMDQYGLNAVDENFQNQIKNCQAEMDKAVELSFQSHRALLKKKMDDFDAFIDAKSLETSDMEKALKESQTRIDQKEILKKVYEQYLDRRIDDFRNIDKSAGSVKAFITEVHVFFSHMAEDLNNLISNGKEGYEKQISKFEELKSKVDNANTALEEFIKKKNQLTQSLKEIEVIQGEVHQQYSKIDWKRLQVAEPLKRLWGLQEGLLDLTARITGYVDKLKQMDPPIQIPQYDQVADWLSNLEKTIGSVREEWISRHDVAGQHETAEMSIIDPDPVNNIFETIRQTMDELFQDYKKNRDKKKLYNETSAHLEMLRKLV
jgi:hypothetical protein